MYLSGHAPITGPQKIKCTGLSVVRCWNHFTGRWDAIRDRDGKPIMRKCRKWAMIGREVCDCHIKNYKLGDGLTENEQMERSMKKFERKMGVR